MSETLFADPFVSTADISPCGAYRYTLSRRWGVGPLLGWCMLNPSTADASLDDPTIRRCIGFAKGWDYGGLIVVNLFALRSTDPAALLTTTDPVGPLNDAAIIRAAEDCREIVAAWGSHKSAHRGGRARFVAGRLAMQGRPMTCLRTSKGGHPCHPLYLPGDLPLVPYVPDSAQ